VTRGDLVCPKCGTGMLSKSERVHGMLEEIGEYVTEYAETLGKLPKMQYLSQRWNKEARKLGYPMRSLLAKDRRFEVRIAPTGGFEVAFIPTIQSREVKFMDWMRSVDGIVGRDEARAWLQSDGCETPATFVDGLVKIGCIADENGRLRLKLK
jgi:hypothetical protein